MMTERIIQARGSNILAVREKTMFKDIQRFNLRLKLVAGLIVATAIGLASFGASAQTGFTTINVSGAGTGAHQGTAATAIDAAGDVAGIYIDGSGNEHAFVLPAGGVIIPFDASGTGGKEIETIPIGFDTAGDLAGIYHDASNRMHGFVRAASTGAITILDVAGEDTGKMEGTFHVYQWGGGDRRELLDDTYNFIGHEFLRSWFCSQRRGDDYHLRRRAVAYELWKHESGNLRLTINASGEVAGFYIDGVGAEHGFLRDALGTITTINAPDAAAGSEQGTIVTGIDAAGDVIGAYTDTNNMIHGFVRSASTGTITVIDAPGAGTATYQGTYPDAIDAAGDISGSFTDANNVVHGFVLPANGTIVTYDAPAQSRLMRSTVRQALDSIASSANWARATDFPSSQEGQTARS